jgi:NAD(P)-dependent dehydrogenase (short-subunit alcohol dehydrogenase family)
MSEESFFYLKGQVAVVTGGAQGIGEGIARRLNAAGARIAILDLDEENAKLVAREIDGFAVRCDVTSATSVAQSILAVRRNLGRISILVNNAGVAGGAGYLWELDESDLDKVYAVNLKGVFLMCRAVIEEMLESGYGRIVNVASVAGKEETRASFHTRVAKRR